MLPGEEMRSACSMLC
jgi:hypothetical protein